MECNRIEEARALKSSFLLSQTSHSQNDEVWYTVNSVAAAPDDFPVEDLLNLDFPEKAVSVDEGRQLPVKETSNHSTSTFSGAGEIDTLSALAIPADDLDNLEWLSQFVDDDSTSGVSLLCPAISSGNGNPQKIIPVKARSKRLRRARTVLPSFAFSGSGKPESKKRRRKPEFDAGSGRRCTHCQVQKTPQWRTGPLGPKTLCNACGVRHKSGRLLPEYRPAFSPSFSVELHSNSHRKVLEMRRKKDVVEPGSAGEVRNLGGVDEKESRFF